MTFNLYTLSDEISQSFRLVHDTLNEVKKKNEFVKIEFQRILQINCFFFSQSINHSINFGSLHHLNEQ